MYEAQIIHARIGIKMYTGDAEVTSRVGLGSNTP